jgi:cyanophycinase
MVGIRWVPYVVAVWPFLIAFGFSQQLEESILGLPKSVDPSRPGAIVLHGGGRVTDDAFNRFVELAGGQSARIVFVPCAGFRVGDYDSDQELLERLNYRYSAWANLEREGSVKSFQFLFTDSPEDADREDFVEPLSNATGVWFSGGSQLRLNYRFVGHFPKQTLFQKRLRDIVIRGGVVGGTSAGTAAMPEIMTMWSEKDEDDAPQTAVAAHGLGLMRNAVVEQHFETRGGRMERFIGLFRDSQRLDELSGRKGTGNRIVGLAVEEATALVVRYNDVEVVGNGHAHLVLKANQGRTMVWHQLGPGESARLTSVPRDLGGILKSESVLTILP